MTLEIVLFVAILAFVSSVASIWAFGYTLQSHKKRILEMYSRLDYVEVGLAYHGLTPLPWEAEDLDEYTEEIKSFKQEGNVVYLEQKE